MIAGLKLGEKYTTDYFVEDDDGTLWWYGRRGSWRADRLDEERREVNIVDHEARFGDRVITLSEDGPVQVAQHEPRALRSPASRHGDRGSMSMPDRLHAEVDEVAGTANFSIVYATTERSTIAPRPTATRMTCPYSPIVLPSTMHTVRRTTHLALERLSDFRAPRPLLELVGYVAATTSYEPAA